jgi:hypothetical protein
VPEPTQDELTGEDWKKFVVGQKVIFLKADPQRYGWGFRRYDKPIGTPGEANLVAQYVGRTGVIVESITEEEGNRSWGAYVVVLDGSGEKVVARKPHLGLLAEMDIVKTYIGKSLWSGGVNLVKGYTLGMGSDQIKENSFLIKDGERIVVTRAEWGDDSCSIYLCFKTLQGQEGCLDCGAWGEITGGRYIIKKFGHGLNYYLSDFYFEDPLKESPIASIQSAEQMRRNLDRLKGTWKMIANYSESGASVSGGRFSLSFGSVTATGETVIEQPNPDTISFKVSRDYSFTLKRDAASKKYILSAKQGNDPLIDDVTLVYRDKEGFIKAGPSKGGRTGFSPKISFDETGGHTWLIKPDFKISFTKPKEGETKNLCGI